VWSNPIPCWSEYDSLGLGFDAYSSRGCRVWGPQLRFGGLGLSPFWGQGFRSAELDLVLDESDLDDLVAGDVLEASFHVDHNLHHR
jgi:hypothetical protein